MANKTKPREILTLERIYNIEMREVPFEELESQDYDTQNGYSIDPTNNIIKGVDLSGNKIKSIEGVYYIGSLEFLNIAKNVISTIERLDNLKNLKVLKLEVNRISEIKGLDNLTNLQSLDLGSNQITEIKGLDNLTNLQSLDLGSNQITEIKGLENLNCLTSLNLEYNRISEIKGLENLTNLLTLDLGSNQIMEIKGLENLTNLLTLDLGRHRLPKLYRFDPFYQSLNLRRNKIESFTGLDNLTNRKSLFLKSDPFFRFDSFWQPVDLFGNRIREIKGLENLINLQSLNLNDNHIAEINGLENLTNLQSLDLGGNQIAVIDRLQNLTNLQSLDLGGNKIAVIDGLENLTNLQSLDLGGNQIAVIDRLQNLIHLQSLDLGGNQIAVIDGLENLTHLQSLYLNDNHIAEINGLENLTHLQSLNLRINQITEIKGLENLTQLQSLELGGNKIPEIKGLENLYRLQSLHLTRNQIAEIKGLDNLTNLQSLDLRLNRIASINDLEKVIHFPEFAEIRLSGNQALEIKHPDFFVEESQYHFIKNYFYKNSQEQQFIQYPLKIMLLGNHASGKSSFVNQFTAQEKETSSTHVLNIIPYKTKSTEKSKKAISEVKSKTPGAIFYDFGGQDYYHGIYQAFLSNQSFTLLFWQEATNRNGYDTDAHGLDIAHFNIRYWLGQKRHFDQAHPIEDPESDPIWLIQTHADENKEDFTFYHGIQKRFYTVLDPEKASASSNVSLTHLNELLRLQIEERKQLKKTEDEIELFNHILEAKQRNSHEAIMIEQLVSIYPKHEKDPKKQIDILKGELSLLARTGLILYENRPGLEEWVWLNPVAVAQYVHQEVLKKELLSNGKVAKASLEDLTGKELLRLLEVQKVLFFDAHEKQYIIPNYLPLMSEDGEDFFVFKDFQVPDLVLKFDHFIPFGYINQLICHFGRNPDKKSYRRNHLVFTLNRSVKVMIQLDFENLKIEVAFRSLEGKKLPVHFTRGFLYELLAIYQGTTLENEFSPLYAEREKPMKAVTGEIEIESASHHGFLFTAETYANFTNELGRISIPHDLYISLNNKDYILLADLEDAEKTSHQINGYRYNEETKCMQPAYSLSTSHFKHISFNKNLRVMKKIFISYSRKDAYYRDELRKHLDFVKLYGVVDHWACEDIRIGPWHEQIQKELESADLVIMLLSIDFFSSRYILEEEILKTVESIEAGKQVRIYPIIVGEFPNINISTENAREAHLVKAIDEVKKHQYGMYDTIEKNNNEKVERIFTLREFKNRDRLDWALSKIVEKIVNDIKDESPS